MVEGVRLQGKLIIFNEGYNQAGGADTSVTKVAHGLAAAIVKMPHLMFWD